MCETLSTVANTLATAAITMVARGLSVVAETATGARNRSANGFSSPPVSHKRPASCTQSKISRAAAGLLASR